MRTAARLNCRRGHRCSGCENPSQTVKREPPFGEVAGVARLARRIGLLPETQKYGILRRMKTTLEIPDDLYRQAKVHAARENRKIKDLVSEGLMLVLGITKQAPSRLRRMTKTPVTIRKGNVIPPLSNDAMATLLESAGERLP